MKKLFFIILSLFSFSSFSAECTFADVEVLKNAEASEEQSAILEHVMMSEGIFNCSVETKGYIFPSDCGRFVYHDRIYKINVSDMNLDVVVRVGKVSCQQEGKRTFVHKLSLDNREVK